jgi:hypothetical protein
METYSKCRGFGSKWLSDVRPHNRFTSENVDDHEPRVSKDGETVVDNTGVSHEHRITWDHQSVNGLDPFAGACSTFPGLPRRLPLVPESPRRSWVSLNLGAPLLSVGVIIKLASCPDSFLTISLSHTHQPDLVIPVIHWWLLHQQHRPRTGHEPTRTHGPVTRRKRAKRDENGVAGRLSRNRISQVLRYVILTST